MPTLVTTDGWQLFVTTKSSMHSAIYGCIIVYLVNKVVIIHAQKHKIVFSPTEITLINSKGQCPWDQSTGEWLPQAGGFKKGEEVLYCKLNFSIWFINWSNTIRNRGWFINNATWLFQNTSKKFCLQKFEWVCKFTHKNTFPKWDVAFLHLK